jgi:hypothetical protein
MDVSQEELRRIGGRFQEKYGLAMDSLTAALLHEVYEVGSMGPNQNARKLDRISEQVEQLKAACRPISTSSPKVSFAYGLGKFAWTWMSVLVMGVAVWLHHIRETTTAEFQQARLVLERYPNLVQLEPLVRSAQLVERKEGTFLQLAPAREKLEVGQTYVVDPSHPMKSDAQPILIPLRIR